MSDPIYDLSKGGIYNIINTVNLKHYIGSTWNLKTRQQQHELALSKGTHFNKHLQGSYNKYGAGAFEFVVIELVADNSTLTCIEQLYLDACWAEGNLYNLSPTAQTQLGIKRSAETRQRMSHAARHKQPPSQKTRLKISLANTGRKRTPEDCAKQSQRQKGRPCPPGTIAATKGKRRPDEVVRQIALSNSSLWLVTFPDAHTETVRNLRAFCLDHGLSPSNLVYRNSSKGYSAVKIQPPVAVSATLT